MKLLNIVHKLRSIIKNYRKYRPHIVYEKHFIELIDSFIVKLMKGEKAYYYGFMENIILEYYPSQCKWFNIPHKIFDDDYNVLRYFTIDAKQCYLNEFLMKLNDYMYNDKHLQDYQKDILNLIISKKYIR